MSTNVLPSTIEQTFAERLAKKEAEKSEAIKSTRRIVDAFAIGECPPDAEVIAVLDQLGVDHIWLKGAIGIAIERKKQAEGLAKIPGKKKQAEALEAEAEKLATEADAAQAAFDHAHLQCKNVDGMTFSPWRHDVTAAELKTRRDTLTKWTELTNGHWLAARDAAELRKEITELSKVDQSLIDDKCGEPAGRDFKLPPLG
jgi:hypothetical protein